MLEQGDHFFIGKPQNESVPNCKVKANLETIMQMHSIAIEKHNNQQEPDDLFDKWNAGQGEEMMKTAVRVMNLEQDPFFDLRETLDRLK